MIFYTLQGPVYKLEIYEDHIRLVKRGWLKLITRNREEQRWNIQNLSQFQISIPQYVWLGKLEWKAFDGVQGSFRFSTSSSMVKKIETYLQKRIIKNHQKIHLLGSTDKETKPRKKVRKNDLRVA